MQGATRRRDGRPLRLVLARGVTGRSCSSIWLSYTHVSRRHVLIADAVCASYFGLLMVNCSPDHVIMRKVRRFLPFCAAMAQAEPGQAGPAPDRTPPAVTPAVMSGLPSLTMDAEDNRSAYLDSCRDLQSAIGSLESALIAFTGKEEGVKGEVFAKTKARLERELAQQAAPADS